MVASGPASAATLDFETRAGGIATQSGLFNDPGIYAGFDAYDQFEQDFGVRLNVRDDQNGNVIRDTKPLALFNSRCFGGTEGANDAFNDANDPDRPACTGGDPDLATGDPFGTPEEDNILVINERDDDAPQNTGDVQGPDDRAAGGTVEFQFTDAGGVGFNELVLIDLDENKATSDAILFDFVFADGSEVILSGANAADPSDARVQQFIDPDGPTGDNSYRRFVFADKTEVESLQVTFLNISGGIAVLDYDRPVAPVPVPPTLPLMLAGLGGLWLRHRRRQD